MHKMVDRTEESFGSEPDWIAAETTYGLSNNLVWLTTEREILPFIPVFDKGERTDGTFSRMESGQYCETAIINCLSRHEPLL